MATDKNSVMFRYFLIVLVMSLIGLAVAVRAGFIMFGEKEYWKEVADRFVKENVPVRPMRGNILSADGKLMASSLPEYRVYMDFLAGGEKKDKLLKKHMKEICEGLHRIFPERSAADFRRSLTEGRRKKSRSWPLMGRRVSYTEYKAMKKLPVLGMNRYSGGMYEQVYNRRKKPFGSLAARTLGDLYPDTALGAKNGIELAFDSLLKGREGKSHRQKVRNRYVAIVDVPPADGCDIVTTLDVDMQDICEKALTDKLQELGAEEGTAILMEVKTGDVKAIVNMTRGKDGVYREERNMAISDMMEPGSTFKTASLMVALEDGKITPQTEVDTGDGTHDFWGSEMRDHNWTRGGYGRMDATRALEVSSNVGVSLLIERAYGDDPGRFVDGLKRMSLNQPMGLQIAGEGKPNIKGPDERTFAKTTLPWMSIGYETQLPPMNMLAFYNAIANGGKMMRPRLVKAAMKDGKTVMEFPTEVINPRICSEKTLDEIRGMLWSVVNNGLGKPAGSSQFDVAGKTGTAQISQGKAGYTADGRRYLVSFCGYFPADRPKYSCIVAIKKRGLPASGGTMAGTVFARIAERVYAKDLRRPLDEAADSVVHGIPDVRRGDLAGAERALRALDVEVRTEGNAAAAGDAGHWGTARKEQAAVCLRQESGGAQGGQMPDVRGMGAKDAVYLLEKEGWKVRVKGAGKVKKAARSGKEVTLVMSGG